MTDEFIALACTDSQFTFYEASKVVNQAKNRDMNVYPYDSTRVKLSQIDGVPGSDYINASHIDGYGDKSAFIATQAPLLTTFADFWRMIWETDSQTIVMLSKEQEGGQVRMMFVSLICTLSAKNFSATCFGGKIFGGKDFGGILTISVINFGGICKNFGGSRKF